MLMSVFWEQIYVQNMPSALTLKEATVVLVIVDTLVSFSTLKLHQFIKVIIDHRFFYILVSSKVPQHYIKISDSSIFQHSNFNVYKCNVQGGPKKKRTSDFLQNSPKHWFNESEN